MSTFEVADPNFAERVRNTEVKRAGRSVTVCTADAFAHDQEGSKLVATMLATMMCVHKRVAPLPEET